MTVGKKTKIPKRVLHCDVRAVLRSCKVSVSVSVSVLTLGASRCSPFAEIIWFVLHLRQIQKLTSAQCALHILRGMDGE